MSRALDGRNAGPGAVGDRLAAAGRRFASPAVKAAIRRRVSELGALVLVGAGLFGIVALASYDPADPSWSTATARETTNLAGGTGAHLADVALQLLGFAAWLPVACLMTWAWRLATHRGLSPFPLRLACLLAALPLTAAALALLPLPAGLPGPAGPAGAAGPPLADGVLALLESILGPIGTFLTHMILWGIIALLAFVALGLSLGDWRRAGRAAGSAAAAAASGAGRAAATGAGYVSSAAVEGARRSGLLARGAAAAGRALTWPFRAITGAFRRRREAPVPLAEMLRRADAAAGEAPPPATTYRKEPSFGVPIVTREPPPEASEVAEPAPAPRKPAAPRVAERSAPPRAAAGARQASLPLAENVWRFPPLGCHRRRPCVPRSSPFTQSMMSWPCARNAAGSMPSGCSRFMWMLPSPIWPKGTGRLPGISATSAAEQRRIISGTRETGTETSFFTDAPSRFCASGCSSRMRQIFWAWASDSARAASSTSPASIASASTVSAISRSPASGRGEARSTST